MLAPVCSYGATLAAWLKKVSSNLSPYNIRHTLHDSESSLWNLSDEYLKENQLPDNMCNMNSYNVGKLTHGLKGHPEAKDIYEISTRNFRYN